MEEAEHSIFDSPAASGTTSPPWMDTGVQGHDGDQPMRAANPFDVSDTEQDGNDFQETPPPPAFDFLSSSPSAFNATTAVSNDLLGEFQPDAMPSVPTASTAPVDDLLSFDSPDLDFNAAQSNGIRSTSTHANGSLLDDDIFSLSMPPPKAEATENDVPTDNSIPTDVSPSHFDPISSINPEDEVPFGSKTLDTGFSPSQSSPFDPFDSSAGESSPFDEQDVESSDRNERHQDYDGLSKMYEPWPEEETSQRAVDSIAEVDSFPSDMPQEGDVKESSANPFFDDMNETGYVEHNEPFGDHVEGSDRDSKIQERQLGSSDDDEYKTSTPTTENVMYEGYASSIEESEGAEAYAELSSPGQEQEIEDDNPVEYVPLGASDGSLQDNESSADESGFAFMSTSSYSQPTDMNASDMQPRNDTGDVVDHDATNDDQAFLQGMSSDHVLETEDLSIAKDTADEDETQVAAEEILGMEEDVWTESKSQESISNPEDTCTSPRETREEDEVLMNDLKVDETEVQTDMAVDERNASSLMSDESLVDGKVDSMQEQENTPEESFTAFEDVDSKEEEIDAFGSFGESQEQVARGDTDAFAASKNALDQDDGFHDFSDDDFGDFAETTQEVASDMDDDFGDFEEPAPTPKEYPPTASVTKSISTVSVEHLEDVFTSGLATPSVPLIPFSTPLPDDTTSDASYMLSHENAPDSTHPTDIYTAEMKKYCLMVASATPPCTTRTASVLQGAKEDQLLRHLRFVLTEKIEEASRHDGVFPHGSDGHTSLVSIANSGDSDKMQEALIKVQNALFDHSVQDAMLRMAQQAALNARAKIAEQTAHQQSMHRGGIFGPKRPFWPLPVSAPTAPSVVEDGREPAVESSSSNGQKDMSLAGKQEKEEEEVSSSREESSNDSSMSEDAPPESRQSPNTSVPSRSPTSSSSSTSSGGFMKKFQDRFSPFSNSRYRAKTVQLRRVGDADEKVVQMELRMDQINGGFDEVKWRCAEFLYDHDEVARVAPAQIQIRSYPSKQPLSSKNGRSALVKFFKPGYVWTVDIGANGENIINEW